MKKVKRDIDALLDWVDKYKPSDCKVPSYLIRDNMLSSMRKFIHDWNQHFSEEEETKLSRKESLFVADIFRERCKGIR